FLHHLEVDGTPGVYGDDSLTLSQFELASRISYFFTASMPSDSLLDRAEQGLLATDDGIRQAVLELLSSRQSTVRKKFFEFVLDWLDLPEEKTFDSSPIFQAFADSAPGGDVTYAEMKQELSALIDHVIWSSGGSINDLLLSDAF